MNKNGFTLIELLSVIAIVSIIALIAVPNVISIVDNNKKSTMLNDAIKIVSLAKYKIASDRTLRENLTSIPTKISFATLNSGRDIEQSPDGDLYDENSYVNVTKVDNQIVYCIYLKNSKRQIGEQNNCLDELLLVNNRVVNDIS